MKRSEINNYIKEAICFFEENHFHLPEWTKWSISDWRTKGNECDEIRENGLGWDVTDFGKGDFFKEGLTLFTIRNGNLARNKKKYCEKIMMVREKQVTPMHFHWVKMEDIINRGGGTLCMKIWKADAEEKITDSECKVQIDGVTTTVPAGEIFSLNPGQSISFEPYTYHTFWAEKQTCLVGEVSAVNDDMNDNRFFESLGRFPGIEEDVPAEYLLCNEYV